jgi:Membrane-bound serine protease (ClpP class)
MSMQMRRSLLCSLFTVLLFTITPGPVPSASQESLIYITRINDTVTPGTAAYIDRAVKTAESNQARAVIIMLDTPGGLVSSTLDIVKIINASRVPVITYVTPRGAISASAGTFILLSGHLAAMAPGTTCGAAMPVRVSSLGKYQAADAKTINIMTEHMKSIAQQRNRPADLAGSFVSDNLSLSNRDAFNRGIIDIEASDLNDLIAMLNGRKVQIVDGEMVLQTANANFQNLNMNLKESLIHGISNPMLAMLLILLGLYGLIFAFHSPGFLLPEILGSICLILGLYGIGLFEINLTAGLLIILGLALLIAEAHTPTWGILGVGGIASIILGIVLFPVEPLLPFSWWSSFRTMALGIGVIGAGLLLIILRGVWKLRRSAPVHGEHELNQQSGIVMQDLNPRGLVQVQGEIWRASAEDEHTIPRGSPVKIIKKQGLELKVEEVKPKDK